MGNDLEVKINTELVKPLIDTKIKIALIEALKGSDTILDSMIERFMNSKVDGMGNESTYSSSKPRLDYLLTKMVEDAMKNEFEKWISSNQEKVAKKIELYFKSKKGSNQLVDAITTGLIGSLKSTWGINFKMDITKKIL